MTEQEIYLKAIETFGYDKQIDMLIEELSELTQAVLKHRRKPMDVDTLSNLHEEFADVRIVMAQIETTLDATILNDWKTRKLNRLEGILSPKHWYAKTKHTDWRQISPEEYELTKHLVRFEFKQE